jgi:Tfp pilus assembly protein PilX
MLPTKTISGKAPTERGKARTKADEAKLSLRLARSACLSSCRNEKGLVLIASLALISILALVATVSVITTYTNIKISSNYKTSIQASYAVEAGYEEARARLRGSPLDANYIGDTSSPPNELWSVYVGTSSSWQTTDDPDYNPSYTNLGVNSLQSDISYWIKIRHKKWSDCTDAEQVTVDTSNTSGGTPSDSDIIYYGYATSIATTAVQFTSDDDPSNASPVDIITSYGSSGGKSSNIIEIQARQLPGPPILASVYGDKVHLHADDDGIINITGNDACSSDAVPAVAYVDAGGLKLHYDEHDDYELVSNAGQTTLITPALDLAVIIDELESTATVILTGDQTDYSVGSDSNYEVVFCDATQLSGSKLDLENVTGYGTLVVRGRIEFEDNVNWNGLIIASGKIKFDDNTFGTINGAILSASEVELRGTVDVYYSSCELDNARSSFRHPTSIWKDKG